MIYFFLKYSTCLHDQNNFQSLLSKCVCAMHGGTEGVHYMEPYCVTTAPYVLTALALLQGGGMGEP